MTKPTRAQIENASAERLDTQHTYRTTDELEALRKQIIENMHATIDNAERDRAERRKRRDQPSRADRLGKHRNEPIDPDAGSVIITARVSQATADRLKQDAAAYEMTISELLRDILHERDRNRINR